MHSEVVRVFDSYPDDVRKKLQCLRRLIFDTAAETAGVGALEETLKWGEPAYLTTQSKSGTTIRLAWNERKPNQYGIYFNCRTTLIDNFKVLFGDLFRYEGNRAVIFLVSEAVPENELRHCISIALTYHQKKRQQIEGKV